MALPNLLLGSVYPIARVDQPLPRERPAEDYHRQGHEHAEGAQRARAVHAEPGAGVGEQGGGVAGEGVGLAEEVREAVGGWCGAGLLGVLVMTARGGL